MAKTRDYTNEILDDIRCYKLILRGELKQFPRGFWEKPNSLESAKVITKYGLEEVLKVDMDELPKKVTMNTFRKLKLSGMVSRVFQDKMFDAIENAYPNKYKRFEFTLPKGYWNENTLEEALRYIIEIKLENDDNRIRKELTFEYLLKSGLRGVVDIFPSIFEYVDKYYPGRFKPWELNTLPRDYWSKESNIKGAVCWVVEVILENEDERVYKEISTRLFRDLGLYTLLQYKSIFELLEFTYPKRFNKNLMKNTSNKLK